MENSSQTPEHDLSDADLMTQYGITCVPTDRFHYKSFRYSTLSDALAQAKRDRSAGKKASNGRAQGSGFCRDQEAHHRDRASSTDLPNVKEISARAADAWGREAQRVETREAKTAAAPSARPGSDVREHDRQFSENPDRGFAR